MKIPEFTLYRSDKSSLCKGRLKKRAISSVISTSILVCIMIIIAIMAIAFAGNVFSVQSESVEFDQAKNIMLNFAGIVEQVSSKQGSSGYVLFNARSGGPSFFSNVGNIDVTLNRLNLILIYGSYNQISGSYNVLKYRGGSLTSVMAYTRLRGYNDTYTYNNNSTLGYVHIEEANASWIVLDYARIGVLTLGALNFSKGNQSFEMVNLIQVQYLNLTKGSLSGSGNIYTVATCKNINVTYTRVNTTQISNLNYTLTITVKLDPIGVSKDISIFMNNTYPTIIMMVRSDVEISMFG
jgi:hypothetical protein